MMFPKHNASERFLFMLRFTAGGVRLRALGPDEADRLQQHHVFAERMTDDAQVER